MSEFTWNKLDEKWIKLVDDHWSYVKGVMERTPLMAMPLGASAPKDLIEIIGWHYKGAMLHGIKHALEECNNAKNSCRKEHKGSCPSF